MISEDWRNMNTKSKLYTQVSGKIWQTYKGQRYIFGIRCMNIAIHKHVHNANTYIHSQVMLVVKKPPANGGDIRDTGSIPGSGRSLGGGHSNSLQYFTWRIPWTEESGRLQSIGSQRVGHNWSDLECRHIQIHIDAPRN